MTESNFMSKSAFAARIGRSPSYITWLKNNDRLVLSPDGKLVDVQATLAKIQETADPSKAAVAARHQQERVQRDVYSQLNPLADLSPIMRPPTRPDENEAERDLPTQLQPGGDAPVVQPAIHQPAQGPDFQKARAHREFYLARIAEAEFNQLKGNLVEREAVEDAAFTAGRTLRDLMFGLAPQLAAELTGMSDSWEVEKRLTGAFRQVFDDAAKMSDADLNQAMTRS
ncbi:polyadenylate binding domain-containing protein [Pseudomonas carassii]|uniref:Terminase small subunit n=1 Tax=Pseudomonas carassii TaxID=3115855 RepID=A0ABU7HDV4_9PSED|nr:terminase small subunit [Pseudomonas sp. 137P]MEE1889489.1 terminase small subunit [Pseudomonas sp. 137P]